VASIPFVQSYISSPISPVVAILAYVVLRTMRFITDTEAAILAAVALIPQLQTLIRNPIPPVLMIGTYLFMNNIGVGDDNIIGNTGTISLILAVAFQSIQESLPTLLGFKGSSISTGTSFYNNLSFLAWLTITIPSIYFFLRGRNSVENEEITQVPYNKSKEGFENIKEWHKDAISLIQLIVLYLLATGVQSFRGLFMNPVPPVAMLGLLAFTMWVQSNNPDADYPDNEGLAAIIAAFGFGSNFTLATPVMNTLFKNTGINPNDVGTVTFSPEPVISPTVATTQSE
jgi:predicted PurR-regulated permease PerM